MNYNNLLQIISQTTTDATGFADDLLAGKEGKDPAQLVAELQTTIKKNSRMWKHMWTQIQPQQIKCHSFPSQTKKTYNYQSTN